MAGLIAVSGCAGDASPENSAKSRSEAVPVLVARSQRKDVPITLSSIGRVEPFSTVTVRSQVSGQIAAVKFVEGQDVKAGDLLFTIDARPFEAELRAAEAEMAQDDARARDAEDEARRQQELLEKNVAAEREHDQAKANAEALRALVNADQARVEMARLRVGYCSIKSPINGRTGNRMVDSGNIVKENETALVQINQLTPIHVAFSVPEQHLSQIKARMAVEQLAVTATIPDDAGPPERGVLTFLDNKVHTDTGTIELKGRFENQNRRLWPGQFVQVALTLNAIADAIVIPAAAVQTGQSGEFVFVLKEDSRVEMRAVKVVLAKGDETAVEGVHAGEIVVTEGQLRLVPGALASIKEGGSATQPATRQARP